MQKVSLTLGLLALVGTVSLSDIYAAAPPSADVDVDMMAREYRKELNGAGALTREMIEKCIILKTDLEKDADELEKRRKELSRLNSELKNLGAYIENNKGQFDDNETSAARVAFNAKVKEYNSRIPQLKRKTEQYQNMLPPYKEKEVKFEEECNHQPYYEDDYKAMVEKMGRGM